jgi:hypothetical protein
MFASRSVGLHLLRGAVGFGAIAAFFALLSSHGGWSLALLALALVALGGCPTCWTIGLIETVSAKLRGRPAPEACTDGSCATASSNPAS